MDRRWHVTDFQRIIIFFAVVVAVFLAAMAWGSQNPWLLFGAAGVLVTVVGGVVVDVVRRGTGRHQIATARVLSVSAPPPTSGIAARCDLRLSVHMPGRGTVEVKHRDPAVPLTRWPQVGQTFPVDVYGGNPTRRLHIRWDLVELGMVRAPEESRTTPGSGSSAPGQYAVWEDDEAPMIISPTPPRPRRSSAYAPAPPAEQPAPAEPTDEPSGVYVFEDFTEQPARGAPQRTSDQSREPVVGAGTADIDAEAKDSTVRTPPQPTVRPNGHDPDGYDPADFEAPRLAGNRPTGRGITPPDAEHEFEAVVLPEFDPADIDRRDFGDDPPAVTVRPSEFDPPPSAAGSEETAPRPGSIADPAPPASPEPSPAIPLPRDPVPGGAARGGTGISATRLVADLDRSVGFYRGALGFTVTYRSTDSAVVELQGTRVLLERKGEATAGPTGRSGELHLDVPDVEAACAAAAARAGEVAEPPAAVNEGGPIQLWRAVLRDPDGHEIEIIEWRQRTG